MKKLLIILMMVSIILTLCACSAGSAAQEPETVIQEVEKIPEKYEDLISKIEAGDFDGAVATVNAMRPQEKVPETIEVTINTENFSDYFEYKEYLDPENTIRDENGNIAGCLIYCRYALKDEYSMDFSRDNSVTADLNFTYTMYLDPQNVDIENRTFDAGEIISTNSAELTASGNVEEYGKIIEGVGAEEKNFEITFFTMNFGNYSVYTLDSVDVTSVSGKIYIFDES